MDEVANYAEFFENETRNPTNEVQVLTVYSEACTVEHEVEMITTTLLNISRDDDDIENAP